MLRQLLKTRLFRASHMDQSTTLSTSVHTILELARMGRMPGVRELRVVKSMDCVCHTTEAVGQVTKRWQRDSRRLGHQTHKDSASGTTDLLNRFERVC